MATIFEKATDPHQYDRPDVQWLDEGAAESPMRRFMLRQLIPILGNLAGKRTLDIGCGSGWLVDACQKLGANAVGIEPSERNFQAAKKVFPNLEMHNKSLQDFDASGQFNLITAVMVFEHLPDLPQAFSNLIKLSTTSGSLVTIVGNKNYFLRPRHGYKIRTEQLDNGAIASEIQRPHIGTLNEIIHPIDHYIQAAEISGFQHLSTTPLVADEQLLKEASRFQEFPDDPIFQLLKFQALGHQGH